VETIETKEKYVNMLKPNYVNCYSKRRDVYFKQGNDLPPVTDVGFRFELELINYDHDKIDEYTMVLLYLVIYEKREDLEHEFSIKNPLKLCCLEGACNKQIMCLL